MSDVEFQKRWREAQRPGVSRALKPLVRQVFDEFVRPTPDLPAMKPALVGLLEFLASAGGRTEPNCLTTDAFFCLLGVERDDLLERFPAGYQAVIDEMGLNLHETFRNPDLAENAEATPEILLVRARELEPA